MRVHARPRPQLAQYGLNVADVNRTVQTAFAGEAAGQVYEGERRFDLVLRLRQDTAPGHRQRCATCSSPPPDGRTGAARSRWPQVELRKDAPSQISARRRQAPHHRGLQRAGPRRGKPW
ncbi:MAG: hypothetical protein WKG07_50305 [Hymenobacter sp.]